MGRGKEVAEREMLAKKLAGLEEKLIVGGVHVVDRAALQASPHAPLFSL